MARKADLTTLIDANIRNKTPKVVKIEHANVEQAIVDAGYTTNADSNVSQTFTTKTGNVCTYGGVFNKTLGTVTFTGIFQNTSSSALPANFKVFDWKTPASPNNNEFIPLANSPYGWQAIAMHDLNDGVFAFVQFTDIGMFLPKGLAAYALCKFQITYAAKY